MFKRVLITLAAVALIAGGFVTAVGATSSVAPSACVKPTSNITHQKMVNYDECRFNELAALHGPAPAPATVTATVTATATATVTASPSPSVSATPTPSPTPTPTPSPTPTEPPTTGWPNASNTGPTGTLTTYTGSLTITTANTVIDSKIVNGDLDIRTTGVVIRNSTVNGTVSNGAGHSFTIVDSLVNAGDRPGTGIGEYNFTVLRTEVIGGNRSINCWLNCDIRDSYVHGQMSDETGVYHESGIRMGAHGDIVHNSIACDAPVFPPDAGCSADLTGYGDFAAVEDMLIQGNRFLPSTGSFCAYGGSSGGKPYTNGANNIRFIDNLFERGGNNKCASYGPITDFNTGAPGNVWSENRWSTGELVPPA